MPITIVFDKGAPGASTELIIKDRLPENDLDEVEARSPDRMELVLALEKFKRLIDEAGRIVERET